MMEALSNIVQSNDPKLVAAAQNAIQSGQLDDLVASKADQIKQDDKKEPAPAPSLAAAASPVVAAPEWNSGLALAKFSIKNSGEDIVQKLSEQKQLPEEPAPSLKSMVKESAKQEAESFEQRAEKIENQHLEKMKKAMRAVQMDTGETMSVSSIVENVNKMKNDAIN
mmetsp:Transcript_5518/g.8660  ORF Transcript_5518/g.8660 Transcript_5518/m.8660 type:complete len:167 (+) Transcript_5518:1214-1714(+)